MVIRDEHYVDPLEARIDHPLLGQRVTVTLAREGDYIRHWHPEEPEPERLTEPVLLTGVLTDVLAGGDVGVRQDDNRLVYGWPALSIEAAPTTQPAPHIYGNP